ncbi:hypothetical protein ElyMa_001294600 [Elysia marginata]|uniref:Fibrinogen C-terminal domain-containing protein n=1 Tax=Elysia marginata TaxID=1093978 RepID=A0AAV4IG34_9GAST|nr:hypothetical protein ElyMa_001294600 [Elysia marginata]
MKRGGELLSKKGRSRPTNGFDFTINSYSRDLQQTPNDRQKCGVLRCTETLPGLSNNTSNHPRRLTSMTVFKNRRSVGDNVENWQQLESVTVQQATLKRVSDGIRATGQLSEHKAELSLDLFKARDCQESQFSCVAVYVDDRGQTSVTKSIVGKAVDSTPQFRKLKRLLSLNDKQLYDQADSEVNMAQLLNLFQTRFDATMTRLDDSLRSLENRMEDKVGTMQATVDNRINNLHNRLEDKLVNLHIHVTEALEHKKSTNPDVGNTSCDKLSSKFDVLENKMDDEIDTCVQKVMGHLQDEIQNISTQINTAINSVKSVEANVSIINRNVNKLETAIDQWALTAKKEDKKLGGLTSGISLLSGLTQNLVSRFNFFSNSYAGGALVPVEKFSDPFHTGKKEWKLVFRGTAYNNIQLYPAYMHGTGIPLEVEEGCKQFNRSLPCINHYRNRQAFGNWVGIDEVLFAIYKDDQMVQSVVFNGKGSTYTNWFTPGRVIQSSWDDLTSQPHNYFSIGGHDVLDPGHIRRFHINRDYDGGCNGFKGWFTIKDSVKNGCTAENTISMPMFNYATEKTFAAWTGSSVARADAIGIFLKYE